MAESRRLVTAGLFVTLALAGAFVVSAIAGLVDGADVEVPADAAGLPVPGEVRVEVLNGAGDAGLARDATHALREAGFDVVFFGNADRFGHARSVAIDRSGAVERARAVAAALRIDSVAVALDSSLLLDVTVVLGDDWPPPSPPEEGWTERVRSLVERDTTAGR